MSEFAELHDELRGVARDLLVASAPTEGGREPAWDQVAAAGWLGLEVPEHCEGAGATFAETAVVLEEMGRAAAPGGFVGTAVLGVGALLSVAPSAARDALLAAAATGETRLAVALVDGARDTVPGPTPFRIAGGSLTGAAGFVPDAAVADELLVVAGDDDDRPVLVRVLPDQVTVEAEPVLDATRSLAVVRAEGVSVDPIAVWPLTDGWDGVRHLHDRAGVALACDSLGLSRAMLDATVAYAGERIQFGRPIGSFQAVKHGCADMQVSIAVAEQLVTGAVDQCAGRSADCAVAASMAKSYACGEAVDVVGAALQYHGGIGYTWESGIHVYLKRALLNRAMFGSPAAHRRWLATRYGDRVSGG